jgi:hypothetical protein
MAFTDRPLQLKPSFNDNSATAGVVWHVFLALSARRGHRPTTVEPTRMLAPNDDESSPEIASRLACNV